MIRISKTSAPISENLTSQFFLAIKKRFVALRVYFSDYDDAALSELALRVQPDDWCIFDNTAAFHAFGNAMTLLGNVRFPDEN